MPHGYSVYSGDLPHFITCTVVYWIPIFCRDDYFQVLVGSFRYCIEHKALAVHGYVLMPNHFHTVCSCSEGSLSDVVRDYKRHTSTELAAKLASDGRSTWVNAMRNAGGKAGRAKVWTDGFHPEEIHSRPFFDQKLKYLHENPVRAGFVHDPCEWKYSSARFYYEEGESLIPITPIDAS